MVTRTLNLFVQEQITTTSFMGSIREEECTLWAGKEETEGEDVRDRNVKYLTYYF